MKKMSRRAIVQALLALPAMSLLRSRPAVANSDEIAPDEIAPGAIARDEIIEVNGWILRRSDLA